MNLIKKLREFKTTQKIRDDNGFWWTYHSGHELLIMDEDHSPDGGYTVTSIAEALIVLISNGYINFLSEREP